MSTIQGDLNAAADDAGKDLKSLISHLESLDAALEKRSVRPKETLGIHLDDGAEDEDGLSADVEGGDDGEGGEASSGDEEGG